MAFLRGSWCGGWTALSLLCGCAASTVDRAAPPALATSDPEVAAGERSYQVHCSGCHGADGRGAGGAASWLYPRPRDLVAGAFRLRSTPAGHAPTEADLATVIRRGIPGSSMPGTPLDDAEGRALVAYLKRLSPALAHASAEPVVVEPPAGALLASASAVASGKALYDKLGCAVCHGHAGRGDGALAKALTDDRKAPIRVRDLTTPAYKGGASARDIFVRLSTGMDGTPMKAVSAPASERWLLAQYIASLANGAEPRDTERASNDAAELAPVISTAVDDAAAGTDPLGAVWESTPGVSVRLFALWEQGVDRGSIAVRSIHDERAIHFRLDWSDATKSDRSTVDSFSDAVALQVSAGERAFVGMGDRATPVLIWHWKADWQRESEGTDAPRAADVSSRGAPAYPAPGLPRDGAGERRRADRTPVHEGVARGPGTYTERPVAAELVAGRGVWSDGRWYVVISRVFEPDTDLKAVERVELALAVWDGANGDRASQKAITSWRPLLIEGR